MARKKNPNNNYFHEGIEQAIHSYNISSDERERNRLFNIIYPALIKLCEVWYNKIKPTYVNLTPDEMQMDCITYILERLHMIKEGKGKAFSYLTVTARNYYIICNQTAYKNRLKVNSLDSMPDWYDIEDIKTDRVAEMETNSNLFNSFMDYMDTNFERMFESKQRKLFASKFIEKAKSYGIEVEFNRRKMLNELSRETGIERGIVTKHVNRIASFYSTFKEYYEKNGVPPRFKEKLYIDEEDAEFIKKNYKHY